MTARTPLRPGDPLPEGWRWVRLEEVASLTMGQSPPSSTYNTVGQGIPFLQGKAEFGEVYPRPVKWCTKPQRIARKGSVLISVRAPVGDVNIAFDEYAIGRGLAAILGTNSLDNMFLFYYLRFSKNRIEEQGTGSTFKSISKGVLQNFLIPLPSLETQRRIVAWLDEAFSHMQAIKERHAEAEREAAALMPAKLAEVFGRAEKEGWRWVRLGEIATVKSGGTPRRGNPSYWGGNIPWVKISDITSFHVSSTEETITKEGLTSSSAKLFPVGTILFTIFATIGKVAILDIEAATNQAIAGIFDVSESLDTRYLAHYLQFAGPQMANRGRGMAQDNINLTMLRSLEVILPPLETQRRIVEEIETFEEEARRIQKAQEESRAALERLEKSLLGEAFRPERWV